MKKENLNNIDSSGFKVPKTYFEGLEDRILSQTKLQTLSKTSGFKTPDGYFNTLETSILEKLNKPEPKIIPLFSKKVLLTATSIAATIALLFSLNFNTTPTLDHLDNTTVENYILDEIEINDLDLLIENTELSQTDFIDYNIIEVEDYIDDIDLNELYQE